MHNADNDQLGANASAHPKYQKWADTRARQASWHFTVDDGPVYQSLPTNEVGWHAGSGAGNCIKCCCRDLLPIEFGSRSALGRDHLGSLLGAHPGARIVTYGKQFLHILGIAIAKAIGFRQSVRS
ncbi:N-acetylmuramoyl-L-alanine amidase [Mesorhizobium sp. BR1-1-6]|nr:N-acetylmuramoyl-L-alanine amidase [Mesorhizobium sp. BR1-1-6]